jgi:phosphopantothenoylcysteine decarboxylase/phosphopantothenate--cysteine ligase
MSSLTGKKIILGISGSIAAYKAAFLVRLFMKESCSVRVIMTDSAKDFISPLTLSTLCKHPVASDVHDGESWTNHVEWGLWADAFIVAPATAHTLAKCALGMASDMLSATYLSARCPVFFAPAMDLDMWHHQSTQENISRLQSYGNFIIDVGEGELASGLTGPGRMAEPEDIVAHLREYFYYRQDMNDLHILINAGPTYEAIDPVRYVGNHSTGKMGVAIAEECASRGAMVHLVLGPDSVLPKEHFNIGVVRVTSAEEMLEACKDHFRQSDITILAAAVADYKPKEIANEKIKKDDDRMILELVRTSDIASTLGQLKRDGQVLVGFALETQDVETNAAAKLRKKNMDMIVVNNPREEGAGFGHDTNKVVFLWRDNKREEFQLKSKKEVAHDIVEAALKMIHADVGN